MKVKDFTFNMFGVNTYVLWNTDTLEAAVVDPGMISQDEEHAIADFIKLNGLGVVHLVNTHLHIDHTFGEEFIRDNYGVKVEANRADSFLGEARQAQARMFGLNLSPLPLSIDVELNDGDKIFLGDECLEVMTVPGHSPGSIVLYAPQSGFVLTGDVLFKQSIGRTDLVAGNHNQLVDGIKAKLLTLPPETVVYPGHGPSTTIGDEIRHNAFL